MPNANATEPLFTHYEIDTGAWQKQTVLTGFFRDDQTASLAVISIDQNNTRHLQLYEFETETENWIATVEKTLRDEIVFVDVARIRDRNALIIYDNQRFTELDFYTANELELVELPGNYQASDRSDIPHIDVTRDLNGDGLDDIVMPDLNGFWVSVQSGQGSFETASKYGPIEPFLHEKPVDEARIYREVGITAKTVPWYLSRIHKIDFDRDGTRDLAFWNVDHFDVYLQNESGQFDDAPVSFTPGVPFDSDGVYSLMFGFGDEKNFALITGFRKKTTRKILHSIQDINGDGVADLVTLTLTGRSIIKQRSTYDLHFGEETTEGLRFNLTSDVTIKPKGKAGLMQASGYSSLMYRDFNDDDEVDMVFMDVAVGFGGMARAMLGNSVPINLEIYLSDGGQYPKDTSVRRKIRRFAPFDGFGNVYFPSVLIGDINDDGQADLLVGQSPKRMHVYLGEANSKLFAKKPLKVAVELPPDERKVWLTDLNSDGKKDLMVQTGPTDYSPDKPSKLLTLIAR